MEGGFPGLLPVSLSSHHLFKTAAAPGNAISCQSGRMSAGRVPRSRMGHPPWPHAALRAWAGVQSHRPHAQQLPECSREGPTRSTYCNEGREPLGKTSATHLPIQPCHQHCASPSACQSSLGSPGSKPMQILLFLLIPAAFRHCTSLKTRSMGIVLPCREEVSTFPPSISHLPSMGEDWEWNSEAEKNECCITTAINTELFPFYGPYSTKRT